MSVLFVRCERAEYLAKREDDYFSPPKSEEPKPITNADRIRAMSDEELAELISDIMDWSECEHRYAGEGKPCHNGYCCPDYWLDWLREEAKE